MHLLRITLVALLVLISGAQIRGQNLIYALSYTDTRASFQARFPTGALRGSTSDKLAMLRRLRKTDIYSYSPTTGERKLLFSDEGSNFEITPTGPIVGGDSAIVIGVMREWRSSPNPGAFADPAALYEIHLGETKPVRRLQDILPNQTPAVLNPRGSKAAIQSTMNDHYVISVYEVPTWRLLSQWELSRLTQKNCQDCLPMSFGWLADDNLFVDLDLGDEDSIDEKHHNVPGIYVVSEKGDDLGPFSTQIGKPGLTPKPADGGRRFLAPLADGSYLFEEYQTIRTTGARSQCFLVVAGPDASKERRFAVHSLFPPSLHAAASGKFVAFLEDRTTPQYRTEHHLWSVDLESGKETEVYVAAPPGLPSTPEPSVTVAILGWT